MRREARSLRRSVVGYVWISTEVVGVAGLFGVCEDEDCRGW